MVHKIFYSLVKVNYIIIILYKTSIKNEITTKKIYVCGRLACLFKFNSDISNENC